MNVVDCIRKFGWEWARKNYFFIEEHKHIASSIDFIYQNQLKRYIDAYDLVQKFGGVKRAKRILKKSYMSFDIMVSVVWNDNPFQCTIEQLEKSVQLVEEFGLNED